MPMSDHIRVYIARSSQPKLAALVFAVMSKLRKISFHVLLERLQYHLYHHRRSKSTHALLRFAIASPIGKTFTLKLIFDPIRVRALLEEQFEVPQRVGHGMCGAFIVSGLSRCP